MQPFQNDQTEILEIRIYIDSEDPGGMIMSIMKDIKDLELPTPKLILIKDTREEYSPALGWKDTNVSVILESLKYPGKLAEYIRRLGSDVRCHLLFQLQP
jgi:hypothetical protein